MSRVIELKDGKVETLLSERDLANLIRDYMGDDCHSMFVDLMEELAEYREEDEDYE